MSADTMRRCAKRNSSSSSPAPRQPRIRPARRDDRAAEPRPADRSRRRHRAWHGPERACREASRAHEPRHGRSHPARPRDAEGPGGRHLHLPPVHLGCARPLRQRGYRKGQECCCSCLRRAVRPVEPGRHGPGPIPDRARPAGREIAVNGAGNIRLFDGLAAAAQEGRRAHVEAGEPRRQASQGPVELARARRR